ncbi:hypothetical protein TNCV_29821 [Trichonephila clavipes]|nr:hypothetical protein TNCV_29821 [Trichonephila clavipes]
MGFCTLPRIISVPTRKQFRGSADLEGKKANVYPIQLEKERHSYRGFGQKYLSIAILTYICSMELLTLYVLILAGVRYWNEILDQYASSYAHYWCNDSRHTTVNRLLCGNDHHTCKDTCATFSYCVVPYWITRQPLTPRGTLFPAE